ncbi:MAG TPA: zinc-binding dehydrogenase [Candidatus Limnocylindrales bacterium]|nr:zinc-binding dehydrogenase [Candidatus Limnocylindrales bacterium]
MIKTRAAVLRQPRTPMTVEEITLRDPGPGEVLVRTMSAGICGTDLHFADGTFPYPLPTVLGHEAAGIIAATGPDVTRLAEGDRVVVCDQVFCGQCGPCLSGNMVYCTNTNAAKARQRNRLTIDDDPARQYLGVSAFSQAMLVDASACIPIPDQLSFPAAALLACCLTTGLATVFNISRALPGSKVAVFGCGGVGLAAIQAARIAGATQIFAVDIHDQRLAIAQLVGATHTINAEHIDPVEAITDISGGGVDRSIEAVGTAVTTQQAFTVLAPTGIATVVGMLPSDTEVTLPGRLLRHGRQIGGTVMGSVRSLADIPRYAELALSGNLLVEPLITSTTPLEQIEQAMTAAVSRSGIRAMISF